MRYEDINTEEKFIQWRDKFNAYSKMLGIERYTEELDFENGNATGEVVLTKDGRVYIKVLRGEINKFYTGVDDCRVYLNSDGAIKELHVDKDVNKITILGNKHSVEQLHIYDRLDQLRITCAIKEVHIHLENRLVIDNKFMKDVQELFNKENRTADAEACIYYNLYNTDSELLLMRFTRDKYKKIFSRLRDNRYKGVETEIILNRGAIKITYTDGIKEFKLKDLDMESIELMGKFVEGHIRSIIQYSSVKNSVRFVRFGIN